jgi:putative ABC transport system substrate-binding protein
LGWTVGRNVQIDFRLSADGSDAAEFLALAPDVIVAAGGAVVGPLLLATSTVPIVFAQTPDPVGAGYVAHLARPGGNVTGFAIFEYGISGRWLKLLKEIAPQVTRVAVLGDPALTSETPQFVAIQVAALSLGIEASPVNVRHPPEMERAVAAFAHSSNAGLIVTSSALAVVQCEPVVTLAARHRLPAIYPDRLFVSGGGLISYGPDVIDQYRAAAGYADRILKGEKPADLQAPPTKFELVINLTTARALGRTVSPTLLARADEVIE